MKIKKNILEIEFTFDYGISCTTTKSDMNILS